MTLKSWSVILFCCFFLSPPLLAQNNRIFFSNLNVNDGLSDNWIKCIYQDRKGFVWVGTNSGLNRFDGYEFEIFRSDASDSTTISDNAINTITEDRNGDLWIGTRSGVSILDNETYEFRRVYLVAPPPLSCQDVNYITAMSADPEGNLLIGTHNGLFLINQKNSSVRHILTDEHLCSSQLNSITSITCDKYGSFWIGTVNGYIIKFNQGSNSFEKFEPSNWENGEGGSISKLFADSENNLWVADKNGLHIFNISARSWDARFRNRYGKIFTGLQITGIDKDPDSLIWITTDGNGVFIIGDRESDPVNITSRPYAEGSVASNGLSTLYCGKSGITWIGNSKKGIDFYKRNVRKFRVFRNYPTDNNSLSNNDVNCITEDKRGNIWIGTNGGGLNYYNRKTNKFIHYNSKPGVPNSLSSNIIVSIFEDSENKIWIGTYLGGLNCLDPETGTIRIYRYNDSDSTAISDDRVWSICEDSRKNLWIATLTGGLNLFDRKTGKFRRFNSRNSAICFDYINHISVDKDDNLWLSSANGLIFYDPRQNRSECYYSDPETPASISDNHIISTFRDSRDLFWVCTNNGLNLMDQRNGTFRVFREEDGLPSNSVLRILEDIDSNLWISTKNGISKLMVSREEGKDSLIFRFINYGMSDGLQGKEFNETAACATRDGELWFGGTEGLNAFYPQEIKENSTLTKLVLTGFRVDNKVIHYGEEINNRVLLKMPLFNTEKITLKYKENSFTIDFAALNYFFPDNNRYTYNLEGFNDKWILTEGKENYATFSNLNNGNYIFQLKGTNTDGIWNEKPVTIRIRVLPPFWKSWYAYVIYIMIILGLLFFLRYLILTRERLRMQIEQEQMESQHIHEIDNLKIKFFTNISHELRTPLTLILSPAEKLKAFLKNKPEEKYSNLIIQNARRLLFMINQLLDFRKMEVQGFGFNPSMGNIIASVREAVNSFNDLAEQKNIQLVFHSYIKELNTVFDKDKLEKIIFNLLSNAFKFTHAGGKVTVTVNIQERIDRKARSAQSAGKIYHLIIRVEDTGIGVPADKIDKLFVSFYQVDSEMANNQGTGIGLTLVKEFVNLHNGHISVESEPGKGSCFTIIIPVKPDLRNLAEDNEYIQTTTKIAGEPSSLFYEEEEDDDNIPGEKPAVLIAEDNDDLRFYLKDNLKGQYNVYEAGNGDEALVIIMKIIPDLIISDIMMPGLDGMELCRRIKSDKTTSHIPVILLTAKTGEEEQCKSLETGADDYITKPFNFQLLEAKIESLINIRRELRKTFRNNLTIEPRDITITSLDEQFIEKALDLVEKNMAKADYTVEELSHNLGLSRTLLYKKILALTGKPPLEFIRTLRLKRAAQLLQKSQLNVSEVAFRVGFNDPKYFRKHFKNEFGILPSRYSEKSRKKS